MKRTSRYFMVWMLIIVATIFSFAGCCPKQECEPKIVVKEVYMPVPAVLSEEPKCDFNKPKDKDVVKSLVDCIGVLTKALDSVTTSKTNTLHQQLIDANISK